MTVRFRYNGEPVSVETEDRELLLDTLRERLGSTSARYSCGIGVCGTCTVRVDGRAVSSCLLLTELVRDADVWDAQGVLESSDPLARRVVDAFVSSGAFQCSYCIPAMALTVVTALADDPGISAERMRVELAGNLCRCGSYPQIFQAVEELVDAREGT